ncbi:3-hydroxyacyl-CoA dehydrogenase [Paraburkholderia sp. GAS448]|uniref:3-hydroxyacyl-CoA dehydrogenase NAD-binding domain-containing protein n=1 Tax=Paraburkholderia sp. GAS448 TaxID=3035136 RepID=UPI003D25EB1F
MSIINAVVDVSIERNVAIVTVDSPPVNALSAEVRRGLVDAFRRASADREAQAIVLVCKGRTFIVGADITEFGKPIVESGLREVQETLEGISKPVIAAIHGTALGGGLELALVAHFRVAVPSAKAGWPEVNIGLLPGAGGTQRLPRIVGVERALDLLTSGRQISAKTAVAIGLFDELVDEDNLRDGAIDFAKRVIAKGVKLRKLSDLNDKLEEARQRPEIFHEFRAENARKFRGFHAPEANIKAIEAAVNLSFKEGLDEERRLFRTLLNGTQSKAQRYAFFAERKVATVPDIPVRTEKRKIEHVGVIGAKTMGPDIAMNFLNVGIPVTMIDTDQTALRRGCSAIQRSYEIAAKKGQLTQQDINHRTNLLNTSIKLDSVSGCELIIEAVSERLDLKVDLFRKLDSLATPGTILATSISSLDIDEIAAATTRARDVIGLHFFSPANDRGLLEVIRGAKTDATVIATVIELGKKIRKVPVVVKNCYGLVGDRMLAQQTIEVQNLLLEGALPWDIDRVIYDFGIPMGPLARRDLAGLDDGLDQDVTVASPVCEALCEMGRVGLKVGSGYYDYDHNGRRKPSAVVERVVRDLALNRQIPQRSISNQEILERCLYPMINEGAKILEEGIAVRASDIDTVWIKRYGWPVYRGGPMFWADLVGLDVILAKMREFENRYGERFKPAALLEYLVSEGRSFMDEVINEAVSDES